MFKSVAARKLAWVVVVGGDDVVVGVLGWNVVDNDDDDDDAVFAVAQIIKFTRINATSFMFKIGFFYKRSVSRSNSLHLLQDLVFFRLIFNCFSLHFYSP